MTASGPEQDRSQARFFDVFPKVAVPMFISMADQSIVATALPAIAGSLGSVEQISLVVIGSLIAATVAAPVYGRLSDRYGRRNLLLLATCIFMFSSLVCAFATSLPMLVIGRIMQGLGSGGLMTLSQALIGESVPPRDRARYQGYLATVGISSNAFGPVMGGVLTELFGWRSIFLASIPVSLLACWLISRLPKRPTSREAFKFDYLGLLLFFSFVVSVLIMLEQIQRFVWDVAPVAIILFCAAIVSLVLLLRVERRTSEPLIPLDLFRDPSIWRANVVAACHGGLLTSLITFLPIYLRVIHQASASQIGLLIVPVTAGIGVGSIVTGQIVGRTGRTAIVPAVGMTVVGAGMAVVAVAAPYLRAGELAVMVGLIALFMGTVMPVVQITVIAAGGVARIGAAAASVQYSRSMGAALVTAIVATVLFATLASSDPQAGVLFGEALRGGGVLDNLAVGRRATVQAEFMHAFQAAFFTIAGFAALSAMMTWTMPLRRV